MFGDLLLRASAATRQKELSTVSKPLIETTAEKAALQDTAAHSFPHRRELGRRERREPPTGCPRRKRPR